MILMLTSFLAVQEMTVLRALTWILQSPPRVSRLAYQNGTDGSGSTVTPDAVPSMTDASVL